MIAFRLCSRSVTAALLTPLLFAAEVNRSWDALAGNVKPGRRVVVVQHSRLQVEGELVSITGDAVTVETDGRRSTIQRDAVFRVRAAGTRARRAAIGFGAGAAAGIAFGANLGSRRHGLSAAVFGLMFAGIGAGAGAAIPAGKPLYEAPGGLKAAGD